MGTDNDVTRGHNVRNSSLKRSAGVVAGAAAVALILSACDSGGGGDLGGGGGGGDAAPEDCEVYSEFGSFDGETVEVFTSIREVEADAIQETFDAFGECVNLNVIHNGSGDFEVQVRVQAEGNNAPDIAVFPQPGLLTNMVADGHIVPAPESVVAQAEDGWGEDWLSYGTIDGTFYAAPFMANVKSFVWYSPSAFAEGGYEIPNTWDELLALTQQIADDLPEDSNAAPWCAGLESGSATGWPATDWLEDLVLRTAGVDVYDQWVTNELPFNDPQIVEALDAAGEILRNEDYVNGGIGDVRSIATTSFNDGGLPILDDNCYMYRMASFYEAQWPEGTDVSEDGDIFAFYLPGFTEEETPLLVAGEFVGAFNDNPATEAVQAYMASEQWANHRVEIGGVVSARSGVDPALASSDILRLSIELLQDEEAVARFDGSDLMPSEVGAGTFWTAMTQWIDAGASSEDVLTTIENSWP